MVIVTHEIRFAQQVADQVLFIDGGVVAESGPPGRCSPRRAAERTRQFLQRILDPIWSGRSGRPFCARIADREGIRRGSARVGPVMATLRPPPRRGPRRHRLAPGVVAGARRPARASCSPPATGPTWSPRPSAACSTWSRSRTPSGCSRRPAGPDDRTDQVRGRLDAVLVAARVAPLTRHIGIVPTQVVTHTEPFHASKAIATLDYVSTGRAGVRVRISQPPGRGRAVRAAHGPDRPARRHATPRRWPTCSTRPPTTSRCCAGCGTAGRTTRRSATPPPAGSSTARSCTTSTSRARTSRSAAPRSPRGRRRASRSSPRSRTATSRTGSSGGPPTSASSPRATRPTPRAILATSAPSRTPPGRGGETVHVLGDVVVFLDGSAAAAAERKERLDGLLGHEYAQRRAGVRRHAGRARRPGAGVAGRRAQRACGCGPAPSPHDLDAITRGLVPELQRRGAFRTAYEADTLRGLLRPPPPRQPLRRR